MYFLPPADGVFRAVLPSAAASAPPAQVHTLPLCMARAASLFCAVVSFGSTSASCSMMMCTAVESSMQAVAAGYAFVCTELGTSVWHIGHGPWSLLERHHRGGRGDVSGVLRFP